MWLLSRAPAHRGETMIALRARREALQVTKEIAYPPIKLPPSPPKNLPSKYWWPVDAVGYEPFPGFVAPPEPEPAPAWFIWLFIVCLTATTTIGFLIIRHFS